VNWENWQLCHKCARILHPDFYKDKKNHGVRTIPKDEHKKIPFAIETLPEITNTIINIK